MKWAFNVAQSNVWQWRNGSDTVSAKWSAITVVRVWVQWTWSYRCVAVNVFPKRRERENESESQMDKEWWSWKIEYYYWSARSNTPIVCDLILESREHCRPEEDVSAQSSWWNTRTSTSINSSSTFPHTLFSLSVFLKILMRNCTKF